MQFSQPPTPAPLWRVVADALPLTMVLILILCWTLAQRSPVEPNPTQLLPISKSSAAALADVFAEVDYSWPPSDPVPRLALQQLPADLADLPVTKRKALFFSSLTPLVLAENARLQSKRTRLLELLSRSTWSRAEQEELAALADRFAVSGKPSDPQVQQRLLARVDEVPVGLALAQAAKESGWGTSRFAREGRNLFGVWTWNPNQGLVPTNRPAGASHLVRVFPDLQASVRNYLHTLNTGTAYEPLRRQRARLRALDAPLDPLLLADGLQRYSERGEPYVQEVRAMIRSNGLHQLGELQLAP